MTVQVVHHWHPRGYLPPRHEPKPDRDAKLLAYDKAHPRATLEEMGKEFGIHRERVRQILAKRGVATHREQKYTCKTCHKPLAAQPQTGNCLACKMQAIRLTLVCAVCGTVFLRRQRLHNNPKRPRKLAEAFCSTQCSGSFMGTHYGFKAHPENTGSPKKEYCIRGHLLAETRGKSGKCRLCDNERARLRYWARKALIEEPLSASIIIPR